MLSLQRHAFVKLAACLCLASSASASAGPRVAAVAAPAADAEPDGAAVQAGDANLASEGKRSGMTFAFSLGGGLLAGFGLQDSVGSGGSASFRFGRVATPRMVINLELHVTASLHKIASAADVASNSETDVVVGPQYYVNPSFWIRGAGGVGIYQAEQVPLSTGQLGTRTIVGPAGIFGLGVDLARFKSSVIGLEFSMGMMASGSGVLITTGADLGLAFD